MVPCSYLVAEVVLGVGGTAQVVPGVGDTALGVEGIAPEAGGTVPGAEGTVPGAEGTVPGVGGIVPGAGGIVPGAEGIVPGAEGTVLGMKGAVPEGVCMTVVVQMIVVIAAHQLVALVLPRIPHNITMAMRVTHILMYVNTQLCFFNLRIIRCLDTPIRIEPYSLSWILN